MALSQSAVSELLQVFRAGQGVDLIRESVRMVLPELIETEAAEVIGTARYQQEHAVPELSHEGTIARLSATELRTGCCERCRLEAWWHGPSG